MALPNTLRQVFRSGRFFVSSAIFGQVFRSATSLVGFAIPTYTLRQVFRSGKFLVGFVIFMAILLTVLIYPSVVKDPPLGIISRGSFLAPGTYVNLYDSVNSAARYTLILDKAAERRVAAKLGDEQRQAMRKWLVGKGIPENEVDVADTAKLLELWKNTFDPTVRIPGMTNADRNYYIRLNASLEGLLAAEGAIVAATDPSTGTLEQKDVVNQTDYVNISEVPNARWFPLGTDNFGRDVLTELVSAIGVSLTIGFVAGTVATIIGLILGLVSGYIGGIVDDLIMFVTNLFTVIPTLILLILISFSIGQEKRGAFTIAVVIGLTSWVWTARAVRAQVISLRNRDHVNLSKLSGHSIAYILLFDILPYIASYVIMALILQISSGILIEATLSVLGLGPRTTEVPTLGLMLNWALIYQAPTLGYWWAYLPIIITIALITFSMNLMNTGLDQVFNPALRE
jgi:peptide/nickel transport system permease protein